MTQGNAGIGMGTCGAEVGAHTIRADILRNEIKDLGQDYWTSLANCDTIRYK